MNRLYKSLLAIGLLAVVTSGTAMEFSVNAMDSHVLPVFVVVDIHGTITRILPAEPLPPRYNRMLDETLREWITKPAMVNGHAVASAMILRVSLDVHARNDGKYDLAYHYISAVPTPTATASSYWRWTDSQLALVTEPGSSWDDHREQPRSAGRFYPAGGVVAGDRLAMPAQSSASSRATGNTASRGH